MNLTKKQETFCQEISKGKSQRQAYYVAYPKSKEWKKESVDERACVLMRNNKVKSRLDELRQPQVDETQRIRKLITDTCEMIVNADISDFYEVKLNEDGSLTLDIRDLSKIENTRAIQEISFQGGKVKIKLESKEAAMKMLEDIHGLNNVQVDADVHIKVADEFEDMSD